MKWMPKAIITLSGMALLVCINLVTNAFTPAEVYALDEPRTAIADLASVKSISLSGAGTGTELVITMTAPVTFTSYKTPSPLRLILDLSQTTPGAAAQQSLNAGNFKSIQANRFNSEAGVLTRLEIELEEDAEAVITASGENRTELHITFPSLTKATTTSEKPVIADTKKTPAAPSNNSEPAVKQENSLSKESESGTQKSLTAITSKNNAIILAIEGGAAEFKGFRLTNPERYVVDLMDTQSSMSSRIVPLNVAGIASARIGAYPDKVRVVLDSLNGSFPDATADKSSDGVTITLSSGKEKTTAKEESPKPATVQASSKKTEPVVQQEKAKIAEPIIATEKKALPKKETNQANPKPATAITPTVEMIDFQVIEGISRISIKVQGTILPLTPVKTPGFVTVTLKNTKLPKNIQRSLEAKSFVSPVLRVTPISVKTRAGVDTKIRIALRNNVPFEYKTEGDMIFVDFKHPENMINEKLSADIQESKPKATTASPKAEDSKLAELDPAAAQPQISTEGKRLYKGRKVTLEFADAEVRKIFQLLSEVSNKNFVLGDDVTGTISIKLVNVPWDQALDIILDTKGLDKREDGNIIIIKGRGKFKSQADEEQEIKKALTKAIELKTEMFSINYSDVASIVTQLNALKTDRGSIAQDSRTNKVIAKDIPQVLDDMRKLISQLDVPEKQVMIEARIVEATSTFTRSLGVNWGIHYRDGSASLLGINQFDSSFGGIASTAAPTSGLSGTAGAAAGISFGTLTSNIQLDLRLNAAASAGLVKIVSTPKVATLNNKTAKITQGQQVPYTSSTSDKVETKFVEAALSLEVTPHINANGTIGMKIDAKNDSVGQATGGSSAPAINKKQATTEMLLRDGETTVIGGIYVDSDNESDDGVPYLMDIPFLGKLFRSNAKTKVKTELLIFITPRILGSI